MRNGGVKGQGLNGWECRVGVWRVRVWRVRV